MPPQSTSTSSAHQVSVPAMVVLALFLFMMAALAVGVLLRQRKVMAALKSSQEKQYSVRTSQPWFSRLRPPSTAANTENDNPTAVGALHAASVLLAAAPCQVFSPPMTMHIKIPLENKTVLILGMPWPPIHCGPQDCGATAMEV